MNQSVVNPPSDLGGVWAGLSGTVSAAGLPAPLATALSDALDVTAPRTAGTAAGTTATGTASANAGDSAAASAPGAPSPAASAWTYKLPTWIQSALFTDWFTGTDGRTESTSVQSLLLLVVLMGLGAGFIYFGVKTLAD